MATQQQDEIIRIEGLETRFDTDDGPVRSVDGVDLHLRRGETLAIVGESGSGKSVTCLSLMGLIQSPGRIAAGKMLFRSRSGALLDLAQLDDAAMRAIRGNEIAMIFQEPMTSLNPLFTVGNQIAEAVEEHAGRSSARGNGRRRGEPAPRRHRRPRPSRPANIRTRCPAACASA